MEDCGAGCDQDGVGVQKAALEVAWRRGLETRLWGAYLVGGKDQEKAAAEVSRAFPSHMCLSVRGHSLPREPPTGGNRERHRSCSTTWDFICQKPASL